MSEDKDQEVKSFGVVVGFRNRQNETFYGITKIKIEDNGLSLLKRDEFSVFVQDSSYDYVMKCEDRPSLDPEAVRLKQVVEDLQEQVSKSLIPLDIGKDWYSYKYRGKVILELLEKRAHPRNGSFCEPGFYLGDITGHRIGGKLMEALIDVDSRFSSGELK